MVRLDGATIGLETSLPRGGKLCEVKFAVVVLSFPGYAHTAVFSEVKYLKCCGIWHVSPYTSGSITVPSWPFGSPIGCYHA